MRLDQLVAVHCPAQLMWAWVHTNAALQVICWLRSAIIHHLLKEGYVVYNTGACVKRRGGGGGG